MQFINAGARDAVGRERIPTKKRLKEMAAEPGSLVFDPTSLFDKRGEIRGDSIPPGVTLSVCGPDPYKHRRWYASVTAKDGKLVVR